MRNQRRAAQRLAPQVESLDERVVPSAMGVAHLGHAALAHHGLHLSHFDAESHLALARHHATAHTAETMMFHRPSTPTSGTIHFGGTMLANARPSFATALSGRAALAAHTASAASASAANPSQTPSATNVSTSPQPTQAAATSTNNDVTDVQNGPLAKGGQDLVALSLEYQKYVQDGGTGTFTASQSSYIEIQGTNVGVDVHGTGDVQALATALSGLGMQVQATDATTVTVEGLLPIGQLVNAAQLSQTVGMNPIYKPALA